MAGQNETGELNLVITRGLNNSQSKIFSCTLGIKRTAGKIFFLKDIKHLLKRMYFETIVSCGILKIVKPSE